MPAFQFFNDLTPSWVSKTSAFFGWRRGLCFAFFLCLFIPILKAQELYKDTAYLALPQLEGQEKLEAQIDVIMRFHPTNPQKTYEVGLEMLVWARKSASGEDLNRALVVHCHSALVYHKYHEVVRLGNEVLQSNLVMSYGDSASTYFHLREAYSYMELYEKGLEAHYNLIPVIKGRDFGALSRYHSSFPATIYNKLEQFERAISNYVQCLDSANYYSDTWWIANFLNNIGVVWNTAQMPDSALFYFDKAVVIINTQLIGKTDHAEYFKALVNGNKAQAYRQMGMYEKAIPLLKEDISTSLKRKDFQNAGTSLNELAANHLALKKYQIALNNLDTCLSILKHTEAPLPRLEAFRLIGQVYSAMGNPDSANRYLEISLAMGDSLTKVGNARRALVLEITHQIREREQQIEDQKILLEEAKLASEEQEREFQKLLYGLILFLILSTLTYYGYHQRSRRIFELDIMNAEISDQKAIIERSLEEKNVLLKEIHHRVKNNLQVISSLLQLQSNQFENTEIKTAWAEGENRVKSMALIHQKLYQTENLNLVPFQGYLKELTDAIAAGFGQRDGQIEIKIQANGAAFGIDTAIPLGLIINELISNSFKYAFPDEKKGLVEVILKPTIKGHWILEVLDNGVGIPQEIDLDLSSTLGLRLVKMLTAQLEGKATLEAKNGTYFSLLFPEAIPV